MVTPFLGHPDMTVLTIMAAMMPRIAVAITITVPPHINSIVVSVDGDTGGFCWWTQRRNARNSNDGSKK
ncbi:hypothetical protein LB542_21845 [Mesorhizobium sp. BR1-1-9]|uniref:hypothetical protein n=1 Tax=Mesorhizobium sp. BR1-1-9 TaxID=2876646 RepID=UPI001CD0E44C|nr:hypothetical protein [Mesorhizobium sp. BR1-1-9]MBZ9873478.1 hypothetical protein [Mesorhizobium sp. BR1-1-9]